MDHVISTDGTPIAYERSGAGPPLVLVHGTTIDHTQWRHLTADLGRHFTVYAVDRRGRGDSGDAASYAIEREFEDLRTLIDAIPGPVSLLGHSYGAICSLESALLTPNIGKLALYEPPIRTDAHPSHPADGLVDEFTRLIEAGEAERALLMAYAASEMPESTLAILRSRPSWRSRVAATRTVLRELNAADSYRFDPRRFLGLEMPILLLVGGESLWVYSSAVEMLRRSLPHSRVAVLSGQQHEAIDTAPELFLREIISFFRRGPDEGRGR
jgi:pimeloyl-ACP methyl ester carboxylesterase